MNHNTMKNLAVLLFFSMFFFSCQKKTSPFNIGDYVQLKIENFEYEGKNLQFVSTTLVKTDDSISAKINRTPRRYEYLLTNKISIDSISKILPDSTKAKAIFAAQLDNKKFKSYFYKTFYNKSEKETFTKKELMKVASKFFLSEKKGNIYSTKICVGINGLKEIELQHKDFTLLEAIVYEAIFERLMNENIKETPEFMNSLEKHRGDAIRSINATTRDSLLHVKNLVFSAMEKDKALEEHLLNYIEVNQHNLTIVIE